MEFEHEKDGDAFTEVEKNVLERDVYTLSERMVFVTGFLQKSSARDEDILLAYFNEITRLAVQERGQFKAYLLVCRLYWHIVRIIKHLNAADELSTLEALPVDPAPT